MLRFLVFLVALTPTVVSSQQTGGTPSARISEETRVLETYPFSEPNPVPILVRDPRLYPYHSFEGYSATSRPQEWKVVKLENDFIEVFVLPEVGGKVWGAVVKETGHEFIYRNEVMKFRNIALRGPWTSGGIEFNFGVIGHTPATATPVDYSFGEPGRKRELLRREPWTCPPGPTGGWRSASRRTGPTSRPTSSGTTPPRWSSPTTTG